MNNEDKKQTEFREECESLFEKITQFLNDQKVDTRVAFIAVGDLYQNVAEACNITAEHPMEKRIIVSPLKWNINTDPSKYTEEEHDNDAKLIAYKMVIAIDNLNARETLILDAALNIFEWVKEVIEEKISPGNPLTGKKKSEIN